MAIYFQILMGVVKKFPFQMWSHEIGKLEMDGLTGPLGRTVYN
jgi:hypothetical protein